MQTDLIDIRSLSLEKLEAYLIEIKEPKFRAKQIYQWLWNKGAEEFDDMTNLSLSLREKLKSEFKIAQAKVDVVQKSVDGTIKAGLNLEIPE